MSLDATKQLLSRKSLGKGGIHGIGVSRGKNAVRIHVSPGDAGADNQQAVLEALKRDAAPYDLLVTTEEGPAKTNE